MSFMPESFNARHDHEIKSNLIATIFQNIFKLVCTKYDAQFIA